MNKNKIKGLKTSKQIEEFIKEQTEKLQERNHMLERKILEWHAKRKDADFAEHFGITEKLDGNDL